MDKTPAAQRKAKVTMTFNALGMLHKKGGGAAMQEEGLEVRGVRRAIAQTLKAKGAEWEVGAGPKTELVRSVEKQLSSRRGCWPIRKGTDSCPERCCAVDQAGAVPQRVMQDVAGHSLAATDSRAPAADPPSSVSHTRKANASALTVPALKRHCLRDAFERTRGGERSLQCAKVESGADAEWKVNLSPTS